MVAVVGFPKLALKGVKPGDAFATAKDGGWVICLQGEHYAYALLGHGGPPKPVNWRLPGHKLLLPGEVQLRPVRDRPWQLTWNASPRPGDLICSDMQVYLRVEGHPKAPECVRGDNWLDVSTGSGPSGSITGPLARGWQLVCFPLPNRPMVLGTYDPDTGDGKIEVTL